MTVEGELDDICGPGQTYAAHILCSSVPERRRAHLFLPGAGHFSLFHGQTCRRTVLPAVAALWRETV
jgi:poly(3-hydroxybutyrate) depolymerase